MREAVPVLTGLAAGVGFIMVVSALFPLSQNLEPKIPEEMAVKTAVQDLTTNYIRNPADIKIYAIVGDSKQSQEVEYPSVEDFLGHEKFRLPMAHTAHNGTYYFVDAEHGSLKECEIPYCPFEKEGMDALRGRFAWIVELVTQCDNYPNEKADIVYAVDAKTGQILLRHSSARLEPQQTIVYS